MTLRTLLNTVDKYEYIYIMNALDLDLDIADQEYLLAGSEFTGASKYAYELNVKFNTSDYEVIAFRSAIDYQGDMTGNKGFSYICVKIKKRRK